MVFIPNGESDDVVPKGLDPSCLRADEDQNSAGWVGGLLIADGGDGEWMGDELVDGGDGEGEVLYWGPWSTFRGEKGETDRLCGHEFSENVSGEGPWWRLDGFNHGGRARMPSQEGALWSLSWLYSGAESD